MKRLQKSRRLPEGQLAKEMRQAPIKETIERLESFMKTPEFQALEPMQREAILQELREAQFELKWGRKPVSQAALKLQISKQHAEMREYISDPTAEKIGKIKKQLAKDKDAIREAEKIAARGELPGARVVDEFIKIHDEYLKGYEKLATELAEFSRKNQAVKGREKEVKRANELIELLKEMAEVGHAKVALQTEKRKALGVLEKPSGAFYKHQLRDLFGEIENFQKQLVKTQHILSPEAKKTFKIGKEKLVRFILKLRKLLRHMKKASINPSPAEHCKSF